MYKAEFHSISTVFEILGANVFIHLGLFMANKAEYKYWLAELITGNLIVISGLVILGFFLTGFHMCQYGF